MSYNVQTGVETTRYRHYLTRSWRHVLPDPERLQNLDRIARLIASYDVVGLQEVDTGSLRSEYVSFTDYLARNAGFPYRYDCTNRRLGRLARHGIGLLARFHPQEAVEYRLPGGIPGRGALWVRFGARGEPLVLLIVHLALGRRARWRQLGFLCELIRGYRHVIVMGDFNCRSNSPELRWFLAHSRLSEPVHGLHTYPSWRPARNIDHILASPSLAAYRAAVLNCALSDHLPVAMEVVVPAEIQLEPHAGALLAACP